VKNLCIKIRTARQLGFSPIFHVVLYRLKLKVGWYALSFRKVDALPAGPFFKEQARQQPLHQFEPMQSWINKTPPNWHLNSETGKRGDTRMPWWKLSDFDSELGDIKCVWEASRFAWVLALAERHVSGDTEALPCLNQWLSDWCEKNPVYQGLNWKCGQEAGIRVLHLAMGALLLEQVQDSSSCLLSLVKAHIKRILPTLRYAMSQDNNHGTSEAAALFIAGSWLARCGVVEGARWERLGRRWLENRIERLISSDGTFSQYSVNYHRLLLDTLCMVELWRRALDLPCFSEGYKNKTKAATHWLAAMVDSTTGDAPNLGAHDGALLFPLVDCDSRDFRPTVQTAMVLFEGARAYLDKGHWDAPLAWFQVDLPKKIIQNKKNKLFDEGGFAVLQNEKNMALLRYPRFRFRPSQADALHVDLWRKGVNHLRDAGTYGYNTEPEWLNYFSGTKSHNTIQFDDRDQMPRLGRFLLGDWLKTEAVEQINIAGEKASVAASYRDNKACYHKRKISLSETNFRVRDQVSGFSEKAVLRWRLLPGDWRIEGTSVTSEHGCLTITSNIYIVRIALVTGWESRYYLQKEDVPVLEVEIHQPGELISHYEWTL
jgi:hypothetical protein